MTLATIWKRVGPIFVVRAFAIIRDLFGTHFHQHHNNNKRERTMSDVSVSEPSMDNSHDEQLATLVSMGFHPVMAQEALKSNGGSVNHAIEELSAYDEAAPPTDEKKEKMESHTKQHSHERKSDAGHFMTEKAPNDNGGVVADQEIQKLAANDEASPKEDKNEKKESDPRRHIHKRKSDAGLFMTEKTLNDNGGVAGDQANEELAAKDEAPPKEEPQAATTKSDARRHSRRYKSGTKRSSHRNKSETGHPANHEHKSEARRHSHRAKTKNGVHESHRHKSRTTSHTHQSGTQHDDALNHVKRHSHQRKSSTRHDDEQKKERRHHSNTSRKSATDRHDNVGTSLTLDKGLPSIDERERWHPSDTSKKTAADHRVHASTTLVPLDRSLPSIDERDVVFGKDMEFIASWTDERMPSSHFNEVFPEEETNKQDLHKGSQAFPVVYNPYNARDLTGYDEEMNVVRGDSLFEPQPEYANDSAPPTMEVDNGIAEYPESAQFTPKGPSRRWSRRSTWLILLGILLLIVAGVVTGVVLRLNKDSDNSSEADNEVGQTESPQTPDEPATTVSPPQDTTSAAQQSQQTTLTNLITTFIMPDQTAPDQTTTPSPTMPAETATTLITANTTAWPQDSQPFSTTPSARPPVSTACYASLDQLADDEWNVTNIDAVRNYVLCANTTFQTGYVTDSGQILSGTEPLTVRRNMHIYCGEVGGSSDNNCVVSQGSFGITSIQGNFENSTVNDNVLIQGITFENNADFAVFIQLPGSYQFVDCVFRVSWARLVSCGRLLFSLLTLSHRITTVLVRRSCSNGKGAQ